MPFIFNTMFFKASTMILKESDMRLECLRMEILKLHIMMLSMDTQNVSGIVGSTLFFFHFTQFQTYQDLAVSLDLPPCGAEGSKHIARRHTSQIHTALVSNICKVTEK